MEPTVLSLWGHWPLGGTDLSCAGCLVFLFNPWTTVFALYNLEHPVYICPLAGWIFTLFGVLLRCHKNFLDHLSTPALSHPSPSFKEKCYTPIDNPSLHGIYLLALWPLSMEDLNGKAFVSSTAGCLVAEIEPYTQELMIQTG